MSPSLLWRLLNGSCAPSAGSAQYTSLNPSESVCCSIVLVCLFVLCSKYGQSSGEEPLRIIAGSQVSVPLISRPAICYRKGGTTPKKLWSVAGVLFGIVIVVETFPSFFLFFNVRHVYYCIFTQVKVATVGLLLFILYICWLMRRRIKVADPRM